MLRLGPTNVAEQIDLQSGRQSPISFGDDGDERFCLSPQGCLVAPFGHEEHSVRRNSPDFGEQRFNFSNLIRIATFDDEFELVLVVRHEIPQDLRLEA